MHSTPPRFLELGLELRSKFQCSGIPVSNQGGLKILPVSVRVRPGAPALSAF